MVPAFAWVRRILKLIMYSGAVLVYLTKIRDDITFHKLSPEDKATLGAEPLASGEVCRTGSKRIWRITGLKFSLSHRFRFIKWPRIFSNRKTKIFATLLHNLATSFRFNSGAYTVYHVRRFYSIIPCVSIALSWETYIVSYGSCRLT